MAFLLSPTETRQWHEIRASTHAGAVCLLAAVACLIAGCGFRLPGAEAQERARLAEAEEEQRPTGCATPGSDCAEFQPTAAYQEQPCWFPVPRSHDVKCGVVDVPAYAGQDDGARFQIAVAIAFSNNPEAAADPVLYLEGGPGEPAIRKIMTGGVFDHLLDDRHLVVIDQRGVGYSTPNLGCPEVDRVGTADSALLIQAAVECREELTSSGVDVGAFSFANSAADVEAVRVALGYPEWNLYGISYGTRLSLTVARDYPVGIRSMALDGMLPIQVDFVGDTTAGMQQSFRRVFAECANQAACATNFGDLEAKLRETVDRYNALPVSVESFVVPMTGAEMLRSLRDLLYNPLYLKQVPALISRLHAGDLSWFDVAPRTSSALDANAWGVYFSLICGEEVAFTSPASVAEKTGDLDPMYANLVQDDLFEICANWTMPTVLPQENEPAVSDIPTLVTSGFFDPITPPQFGTLAAETLENSFAYVLNDESHGSSVSQCGADLVTSFFTHPETGPTPECVARVETPVFDTAALAIAPAPGSFRFVDTVEVAELPPPTGGLLTWPKR